MVSFFLFFSAVIRCVFQNVVVSNFFFLMVYFLLNIISTGTFTKVTAKSPLSTASGLREVVSILTCRGFSLLVCLSLLLFKGRLLITSHKPAFFQQIKFFTKPGSLYNRLQRRSKRLVSVECTLFWARIATENIGIHSGGHNYVTRIISSICMCLCDVGCFVLQLKSFPALAGRPYTIPFIDSDAQVHRLLMIVVVPVYSFVALSS